MPWEKNFDVEQTLEKAMHAFWSRGYEATSIRDLVGCMGVNRASLYGTYGDKRELFLAALRLYDETVRKARLAALEASHSPREAIRQLFQGFVGLSARGDARRGCFLTNSALEVAPHDPEVARIVADAQSDLEAFFRRTVERGQASGEIASREDPAELARGLLAALLGLLVLARSRPEPALLQSITDQALKRLA